MAAVIITTGIPGNHQESDFMNATLQSAGRPEADEFEYDFSIATHLKVPDHVLGDQEQLARYIEDCLCRAAAALPPGALTFEVQVGPFGDGET